MTASEDQPNDGSDASIAPCPREQRRMLRSILRQERGLFLRAFCALLGAALLLYLVPLVPQATIDIALGGADDRASGLSLAIVDLIGGPERVREQLWRPALLVVGVAALAALLTYLRQRWAAIASQRITRNLRERLYDRVQRMPVDALRRRESGDVLQRCGSDVDTVQVFLASQVVEVGRAFVMLLVPLPLMLSVDWRMTLVSLALIPFIVFYGRRFFVDAKDRFQEAEEAEGALTAVVQESLSGVRVVRAFARHEHEYERFARANAWYRGREYRGFELHARYWSASDLLCLVQQTLVIACGAMWMIDGSLSVGGFYFFLAAVTLFLWPLRMAGRLLAEFGKALVAAGRIGEVLDEPIETDVADPVEPGAISGAIMFRNVTLRHAERLVLDRFALDVAPGETVALLGASGSGKTSAIELLLRIREPDGGEIRIDDVPIDRYRRSFLRESIATVMQQPFLYSRSLGGNISIAADGGRENEIRIASEMACLHETIEGFDDGYETVVGERGVTLSGGQRQRVAIARALIREAPILVLDDALSAVDTRTERRILDALRARRGRRTTLVIAHRLSTLRAADRIVVLENGRVRQEGAHAELVSTPGTYARLWAIQTNLESEAGPKDTAKNARVGES